jgi:hypothetical protein
MHKNCVFSFSFDGCGYRTIGAKEMPNFVRKQIKKVTTLDYEALLANDQKLGDDTSD